MTEANTTASLIGMHGLLLAMIDSTDSIDEQNALLDVIDRIVDGEPTPFERLGPSAQAS